MIIHLFKEPGEKTYSIFRHDDSFLTSQFVAEHDDAVRLVHCWNACEGLEGELVDGSPGAVKRALDAASAGRKAAMDEQERLRGVLIDMGAQIHQLIPPIEGEGSNQHPIDRVARLALEAQLGRDARLRAAGMYALLGEVLNGGSVLDEDLRARIEMARADQEEAMR